MSQKRPDIVVLHGWNLSGATFAPLVRALEKQGMRVFCPDLPGFGTSTPPLKAWHVSDYATFLSRYIQKNRMHTPILVGHSFGGRVALEYVRMYPGSIAGLVLTGTPGYTPVRSLKRYVFYLMSKVGAVIFSLPLVRRYKENATETIYAIAGAREYGKAKDTMKQTFKNVVSYSLVPAMKSVNVPCLLLWGEDDQMVPVSIAGKMQKGIAGSSLVRVPGIGHALPYARADVFASKVREFIQTHL